MLRTCRLSAAVAALGFRVSLRSRAFAACCLLAAVFAAMATVPVSPGLSAGKPHHLEAGISILLLGGVILSLVVWPRAHLPGRSGRMEEAVLALPLRPEVLAMGSFLGFGAALAVFFAVGGGAFAATALAAYPETDPGDLVRAAAAAWLMALIAAALVAALSAVLAPLPVLAAAVLVVLAGQATAFWPAPVAAVLPPFDVVDPAGVFRGEGAGFWGRAARGAACLGFYLCLAEGLQAIKRGGLRARSAIAGPPCGS
jgi:hypothetical protein